jgi:hypothetical protein
VVAGTLLTPCNTSSVSTHQQQKKSLP